MSRASRIRRAILRVLSVLLCASGQLRAQMKLGDATELHFASVEQGRDVLGRRDAFIERLSPFDRAARLKVDRDVPEPEFLQFLRDNVVAWTAADRAKVAAAFVGVHEALAGYALPFPRDIALVKTTGREEGGAPYTRAHAIVLPAGVMNAPAERIQEIIAHELFHVLTRANPDMRDPLYALIGFAPCGEVSLPGPMDARRITNPDAPRSEHAIRIEFEGEPHWATPVLLSRSSQYDATAGGEFFSYLQFRLLLVERDASRGTGAAILRDGAPLLVDVPQVAGFFEQVGRNTDYIIHPEEILASNFALLVQRPPNVPSPEVLDRFEDFLRRWTVRAADKPGS